VRWVRRLVTAFPARQYHGAGDDGDNGADGGAERAAAGAAVAFTVFASCHSQYENRSSAAVMIAIATVTTIIQTLAR